ncbi:MAG: hypothetical protein ABIN68_01770 [Sphingomicrobium sp.]
MAVFRPALAMDPRRFGRAVVRCADAPPPPASRLGDDARLFAMTFAAGFLFVSIVIG